ncbi:MAG: hypothetical protein ACYCW6_28215, partial [Candidatus Xenobia bacterium]
GADLTVEGCIKGTGCVLVDGNVTIKNTNGASSLTAQDTACIIATGSINIVASGSKSNVFNGLLYSQSSLSASGITLVGAVLVNTVNGPNGATGSLSLSDCQVVQVPGFQAAYTGTVSATSGKTTFNFVKGSGGFAGGIFGGIGGWAAGRYSPNISSSINVPTTVTWIPPNPNTFRIAMNGVGTYTVTLNPVLDPSVDPALKVVEGPLSNYVKSHEPKYSYLGIAPQPEFSSGDFDATMKGLESTLGNLGKEVYSVQAGVTITKTSTFYINLNQCLDPADQMRPMLWMNVDAQDINHSSGEWQGL